MNELKIFENEEFGQVRTILINNESWFVGKDVATALGYANPKNAVPKHVSDEDKLSTQIEYAGQRRTVTVINDRNGPFYSRKQFSEHHICLPDAIRFQTVLQPHLLHRTMQPHHPIHEENALLQP